MKSLFRYINVCFIFGLVASFSLYVNGDDSIIRLLRFKRNHFAQKAEGVGTFEDFDRANGRFCKFNNECSSGCCLAPDREVRRCAPLATLGQHCEIGQIKGGFYADFCPCVSTATCDGTGQQKVCI